MNTKRRQSFGFLPLDTSDDDYYELAVEISNALVTPAKTIEQSSVSLLMEG
ncbi:MAG: hypothetical protein FWC47_01335 [Oscillospiraceae bacterium]|nr:hypothetical protein [Oscillospiraceae bacterium]